MIQVIDSIPSWVRCASGNVFEKGTPIQFKLFCFRLCLIVVQCPAGILGSLSLIMFCWLASLEAESTLRPTLCGLLITSRYVITYALSVYLFWSFVFRMLLVLYADRGLVGGGGTNLQLFHHLFWLIFTTLVVQVSQM